MNRYAEHALKSNLPIVQRFRGERGLLAGLCVLAVLPEEADSVWLPGSWRTMLGYEEKEITSGAQEIAPFRLCASGAGKLSMPARFFTLWVSGSAGIQVQLI